MLARKDVKISRTLTYSLYAILCFRLGLEATKEGNLPDWYSQVSTFPFQFWTMDSPCVFNFRTYILLTKYLVHLNICSFISRQSPRQNWLNTTMWVAATFCGHGRLVYGRKLSNSLTRKSRSSASRTATFPCSCPKVLWRRRNLTFPILPRRYCPFVCSCKTKKVICFRFNPLYHSFPSFFRLHGWLNPETPTWPSQLQFDQPARLLCILPLLNGFSHTVTCRWSWTSGAASYGGNSNTLSRSWELESSFGRKDTLPMPTRKMLSKRYKRIWYSIIREFSYAALGRQIIYEN